MSSDDGPHTRTVLPEDDQPGSPAGRPRPLRSLLITITVLTLVIAGIALANRVGGGPEDDRADRTATSGGTGGGQANPTAPSGVPPVTTTANGHAKGFDRTAQGAQSAAANYAVALGSEEMFKKDERHEIIDRVYTPDRADVVKRRQDRAFTPAILRSAGLDENGDAPDDMTFVSRTVPVGTKAEKYADDGSAATVSVWCTGLTGMAGTGSKDPVRSDWFTYTFELRWTGGDWKVAEDTREQGPAPVDGDVPVSGADDIAGAVKEFGGFTYAR